MTSHDERAIATGRLLSQAIRAAIHDKQIELEHRPLELILDNDFVSGAVFAKRELAKHFHEFSTKEDPRHISFVRKCLVRALWSSGCLTKANMLRPHRTELVNDVMSHNPSRAPAAHLLDDSLTAILVSLRSIADTLDKNHTAQDITIRIRSLLRDLNFQQFIILEAHLFDEDDHRRAFLARVLASSPVPGRAIDDIMSEALTLLLAAHIFDSRSEPSASDKHQEEKAREAAAADASAMIVLAERFAAANTDPTIPSPRFVTYTNHLVAVASKPEHWNRWCTSARHDTSDSALDHIHSCIRSDTYLLIRALFPSLAFGPASSDASPSLDEFATYAAQLEQQTLADQSRPEIVRLLIDSFTNDAGLAAFVRRVWMPAEGLSDLTEFQQAAATQFSEVGEIVTRLQNNSEIVSTIIDVALDEFASEVRVVTQYAKRFQTAVDDNRNVQAALSAYLRESGPIEALAASGIGRWLCLAPRPVDFANPFVSVLDGTALLNGPRSLSELSLEYIQQQRPLKDRLLGSVVGLCIGHSEYVRAAKISHVRTGDAPREYVWMARIIDIIATIVRSRRPIRFEIVFNRIDSLSREAKYIESQRSRYVHIACAWIMYYWLISELLNDPNVFLEARAEERVQTLGNKILTDIQSSDHHKDLDLETLSQADAVTEMLDILLNWEDGQIPSRFKHTVATDPYELDAVILRESMLHLLYPERESNSAAGFETWVVQVRENIDKYPDASFESYRKPFRTRLGV